MKKIVYFGTQNIQMVDIPLVLETMGYNVVFIEAEFETQEYNKIIVQTTRKVILDEKADYVITCDFQRIVAEASFLCQIPYIAWVYDCPQSDLYSLQAFYNTNNIFVFDKMQCERIKRIGVKNVFHSPLAIYPDRIRVALSDVKKDKYINEICFIGQLYIQENNEEIIGLLSEYGKERWKEIVDNCYLKWNDDVNMYGIMSKEFVELFASIPYGANKNETPFLDDQFRYETAVLSRHIAHKERVEILNSIAEEHQMTFYTNDTKLDELSDKICIRGGMNYSDYSIFQIYNSSKININITLHCIETGIPQRVFDVMASGGFMLTNYQKEVCELFEVGKEIEVYHNKRELLEKIDYYLKNESDRERIAKAGQKRVLKNHDYRCRFEKVIKEVSYCKSMTEIAFKTDLEKIVKLANSEELVIFLEGLKKYGDIERFNILKYGLINTENDLIRMYLASFYMDIELWEEARIELTQIKSPSMEILDLIHELEQNI